MDDAAIAVVRSFNRTVTERIGALDEEYLARGRPLGASRLLWEVPAAGTDSRALRGRLDLDSGYLSRLLRRLEGDGLIAVSASEDDQRVRTVQLTRAGRSERAVLDRRSDELAWSLLEPLDEPKRAELVAAMATVERLLTASAVTIAPEDPTTTDALACWDAYFAELDRRFRTGFDPSTSRRVDPAEVTPPAGVLLLARLRGRPVGSGSLRLHPGEAAEIKRMWVSPDARGLGVGRRLLGELERRAVESGATRVHLDTNAALVEAIAMYRSNDYREVAPFNDEAYADLWFEKDLRSRRASRPRRRGRAAG